MNEYDGDRAGRRLGHECRWGPNGHDQVDRKADEFGGKVWKSFGLTLREAPLNYKILRFDPAEVMQSLLKCLLRRCRANPSLR